MLLSVFRPRLLTHCKMVNKTWDSLHISCRASDTNVSPEQFKYVARLTDVASNLTKIVTGPAPDFELAGLEAGTRYKVELFVENKMGAGPALTLLADTNRLAEKRTAESKIALQEVSEGSESDLVMVIIGVTAGLVMVTSCVLTTSLLLLSKRRRHSQAQETQSLGTTHSSLGGEIESESSPAPAPPPSLLHCRCSVCCSGEEQPNKYPPTKRTWKCIQIKIGRV